MYQPTAFREANRERIHALIDAHSFGTLIVPGPELEIAHLPFVLDRHVGPSGRLRLHVARANRIWEAALQAGQVTAVFTGPHAYVSPGWYQHPAENVPTWNYAVAHAHGRPTQLSGEELIGTLDDLVSLHEGAGPSPWRLSVLAPALREKMLREIVGLSIEIVRLEGKFKLSQNRSMIDVARVIDALDQRGNAELVRLMREGNESRKVMAGPSAE